MPREHKKRGRREERKKRKHDEDHDQVDTPSKRLRTDVADDLERDNDEVDDQNSVDVTTANSDFSTAKPFFGLLDEEEQAYFHRADEMLELNQFPGPEERSLFIANVFREADGKELKMASSQSCSRLMERLISLSSPAQLKILFRKFSGNFLHLVDHRFASHCCEALFIHSAPTVTRELVDPLASLPEAEPSDDVFVSMDTLFLHALNELQGNFGYLFTSKYASHVLRVLLLVLSGLSLSRKESRSLLQGKGKEKVTANGVAAAEDLALEDRAVPQSFSGALEKLSDDALGGMDTTALRALATHPTGNPTLQLFVKIELTKFGKQRGKEERSIIRRLLPDDPLIEGTESGQFINGLVYDAVGSRLLETIIEFAPGKMFKTLYREFFKQRIGSLARNEIAGYVVSTILQRLGKDDLQEASEAIMPQIEGLVERNRTSVIKTLIERYVARELDTIPLAHALSKAYGGSHGFDIARLLKLGDTSPEENLQYSRPSQPSTDRLHGSLLAQTMVAVPGPLSDPIFDALARLGTPLSLKVSKDPIASHTLQAALTVSHASIIFRRKMIQQFYGHVGEMALDPSASHVIDAVWNGTQGLAFIRERIAEELAENEAALRESFAGRAVWKNWQMDLYRRRRADWVKQSRVTAGNERFVPFPEANGNPKEKTRLELARERHVAKKKEKTSKKGKEAVQSG